MSFTYICIVLQDITGSSKSAERLVGNVKARILETTLKSSVNEKETFELNSFFHGEPVESLRVEILEHRCNMDSEAGVGKKPSSSGQSEASRGIWS